MNAVEKLEVLREKVNQNPALKKQILETRSCSEPLEALCRISCENGIELYPMEIILDGEEFYAAMKRSTNGGGENSPVLSGEDDAYELFMLAIEET